MLCVENDESISLLRHRAVNTFFARPEICKVRGKKTQIDNVCLTAGIQCKVRVGTRAHNERFSDHRPITLYASKGGRENGTSRDHPPALTGWRGRDLEEMIAYTRSIREGWKYDRQHHVTFETVEKGDAGCIVEVLLRRVQSWRYALPAKSCRLRRDFCSHDWAVADEKGTEETGESHMAKATGIDDRGREQSTKAFSKRNDSRQ